MSGSNGAEAAIGGICRPRHPQSAMPLQAVSNFRTSDDSITLNEPCRARLAATSAMLHALGEKALTLDRVDESPLFAHALSAELRRHQDTCYSLAASLGAEGITVGSNTLRRWMLGRAQPAGPRTLEILFALERRYSLPKGYFMKLMDRPVVPLDARSDPIFKGHYSEFVWHLPGDFFIRSEGERKEIVKWVRQRIFSGTTEFSRYQKRCAQFPYAIYFENPFVAKTELTKPGAPWRWIGGRRVDGKTAKTHGAMPAPPSLADEVEDLALFKTSTFARVGWERSGAWTEYTMLSFMQRLGRLFGALAAEPNGPVQGRDVPLQSLTMGILAFPKVWDWYLQWCQSRRRGLLTLGELVIVTWAATTLREKTGWLTQRADLCERVTPIEGLISHEEIDAAKRNWAATCESCHMEMLKRRKDLNRVASRHRSPFEAVLPVLNADSPVKEYLKIAEEISRRIPDASERPRGAAVAVRSYLMVRLALILDFRQKNLRELLVCLPGQRRREDAELEALQCGELRRNDAKNAWEVFAPTIAFKNNRSSFFDGKPFEITLSDKGGLYCFIDDYLSRHRPYLLNGHPDPGTFFVRMLDKRGGSPEFSQGAFYDAWSLMIQRYGIYNPYTGLGAIEGLLPHGPHSVRHVLAVHLLKTTGSLEYASYAIQNIPRTIVSYYARFCPKDKTAIVGRILDQVWHDNEFDFQIQREPSDIAATRYDRWFRRH